MALRQAGSGAARLLLLSARPGAGLFPGATAATAAGTSLPLGLSALALHAASIQLPRALHGKPAGGLPRYPPPPPLLPGGGLQPWVALRGLQVPSGGKEEGSKAVPDAAECDEAIEKYREVRYACLGRV